ncbi:Alpha/Beta hydrolase protein [Crepidotus variabilis]|uniref:Alpha/Beta hydrolase protein n=1 Tax=Crepidotus variabilis TaxID=179855 RepID=A0A9P6EU70_9AGAR|nr:Alpha/Beta hydrolase protein [Crepidotus variabilis]
MDPSNPESFNHRSALLSTGRTYHFVDQVPKGYDSKLNPTLLCVHGFPDLWYGWRHQIGPWVRHGLRVVAPDMLGYGGTSKPTDPAEYTTSKTCADLVALLELLEVQKAVLIGHDWGSAIVGRFALWYPERILALVMISVPYSPPARKYIPLEEIIKKAPNLGYQAYFASEQSTEEIDSHEGSFRDLILDNRERKHRLVLTPQEFSYYNEQLSQGMRGPLNYYRTTKLRFDEEKAANLPSHLRDDLPFLFIYGTEDGTVVKPVLEKSKKFIKRYQEIVLEGRGHWLMVEAKDEFTEKIASWLEGLTSLNLERQSKL